MAPGLLRDLALGGCLPEFAGHEQRLSTAALTQRAKHYHIRVYLYLNEPRDAYVFFKDRSTYRASQKAICRVVHLLPEERRWMTDALTHIFREVTDWEEDTPLRRRHLTNCASQAGSAYPP